MRLINNHLYLDFFSIENRSLRQQDLKYLNSMGYLSRLLHSFAFSTAKPALNIYSSPLKDYQYSSLIQSHISRGDFNLALNTLIQSHLHNCVLDIQTYYSVLKSIPSSAHISFTGVVYKLFRMHFKATPIMEDIIKRLFTHPDADNTLKTDFQYLGIPLPQHHRSLIDQAPKNPASLYRKDVSQLSGITNKVKIPTVNDSFLANLKQNREAVGAHDSLIVKLQKTVTDAFSSLDAKEIILEDVEITMHDIQYIGSDLQEDEDEMESQYYLQQDENLTETEQQEVGLYENGKQDIDCSLIKSIKIGRIEIIRKKDS